ncbi:zinc ribbon domain-containing protein [Staphylococcus saprophyticus]|uniref:zinc ribbon domain-containing protein n=1 Tax=Staphylococcus saprophyticus TaxID=29385 RepID=UPI0034C5B81A
MVCHLIKKKPAGTESDGILSKKYCLHCYQDGAFTMNLDFDAMYAYNLKRFQ